MAKRSITQEAIREAKLLRSHALESAKAQLTKEASEELKRRVSNIINEELGGGGEPPGNYDQDGEQKRVGEEQPAKGEHGDDMSDEGDGAAVVEDDIPDAEPEPEPEETEGGEEEEDVDWGGDEGGEDELSFGDDEEEEMGEQEELDVDNDEDLGLDVDGDNSVDEEDEIDVIDDEPHAEPDADQMGGPSDDDEDNEEIPMEASTRRMRRENRKLRRENFALRSRIRRTERAIVVLKEALEEVNLFNARFAALQKIQSKTTLPKASVDRIVRKLDECNTIADVKRTYNSIMEGLRVNRTIRRNKVNRPNALPATSKKSMNENREYKDLQRLAGLL